MSIPAATALYEEHSRELSALLEQVLTGEVATEWTAVERQVVASLGALVLLQQRHRVDQHGWCSICRAVPRAWWPVAETHHLHSA